VKSGAEFPRAYYVANQNKADEADKINSKGNRITALMLKVAKDLTKDKEFEAKNNAVILGEGLELEKGKIEEICYCQGGLTVELFKKIFGDKILFGAKNMKYRAKVYNLETQKLVEAINNVLGKYDINTCLRLSHFLAQIEHESDHFNTTEEYASGSLYEGRKDLGNTEKGDGKRFKGRGLIQLTGRANYTSYTNYIKEEFKETRNFIKEPDNDIVASEIKYAVDAAGWYWKFGSSWGNINIIADKDDVTKVTMAVNGGERGLADRKVKTGKAKILLNVGKCRAKDEEKQVSKKEGYDIDAAVNYIIANAESKSIGYCATYVRLSIEAGGIDTSDRPAGTNAKDYDTYLPKKGFVIINSENYTAVKGDIAVFEAFQGEIKYHKWGHIQMHTGSQWISDFIQSEFWAGSDYEKAKPKYKILRWE
ncbi:glycoside hydrolase family 19 protein, partial [Mariniflexile ostreae]